MKKKPIKPARSVAATSNKKISGKKNTPLPAQISPKLAALKRALDDGSFDVDSEVVADQLIGDSRRILRRPGKKH